MLDSSVYIEGYKPPMDQSFFVDSKNISVSSCGHCKLIKREKFWVSRPSGRNDFQILYVSEGATYFNDIDEDKRVSKGNLVVYKPNEPQMYRYLLEDNPDVYWLHFSGTQALEILEQHDFTDKRIHYVGINSEVPLLFDKIMYEMQIKRPYFTQLINARFLELLSLLARSRCEHDMPSGHCNRQLDWAIEFFYTNINTEISIKDCADQLGMSLCWFSRCFRERFKSSPQIYITNIRLNRAKELLLSSTYNVNEIATLTGYNNAFYFSRIFKNHIGCSPSEYRRKFITHAR